MRQVVFVLLVSVAFLGSAWASGDPWSRLRDRYDQMPETAPPENNLPDPWQQLRAVSLPFTSGEEMDAVGESDKGGVFSQKVNRRLEKFNGHIILASGKFGVPPALIRAVIMAESGGNPSARTKLSSAKGLMQTIDSTFSSAVAALEQMDIHIKDDPFDPGASIMAGTWYLSKMYEKACSDGKILFPDKKDLSTWRYPLEYYYAGPQNGAKKQNRIYVFSNGTRRVIDKRAYSGKIQKWAGILAG